MNFIYKMLNSSKYIAGPKAPADIVDILSKSFKSDKIKDVEVVLGKVVTFRLISNGKRYSVIQYPFMANIDVYRKLNPKNIIYFVHDLNGIRYEKSKKETKELKLLKRAKAIVSHNQIMTDYLISKGIDGSKIVNLNLFDYLCDDVHYKNRSLSDELSVAYAGNMDKAVFITQLESEKLGFTLKLYGRKSDNLKLRDKVVYAGKANPDKLPDFLDANLGLVWDGNIDASDEADLLKKYTKYNNPHKASGYLAAGMPIVVWSKSAIWNFVKENNCGYCVDDIYDINGIDLSDYEEKKKNSVEISEKIRSGYYTKTAFEAVLNLLSETK